MHHFMQIQFWAFILFLQSFESKGNDKKLVMTMLAIYDHITSTLQHHSFSVSEPLVRLKRKTSGNSQEKDGERALPEQDPQEERENVLDSALPPLTFGIKHNRHDMCIRNMFLEWFVLFL